MRKNFISTASLQQERSLRKAVYESQNEKLKYNTLLSEGEEAGVQFPILQPMANTANAESPLVFTTIVTKGNPDAERNYALYKEKVKKLMAKKQIPITDENFQTILLEGKDSMNEQLGLFESLIQTIHPKDQIQACLTFGNKPNIVTLHMALEYARLCIEGVEIENFVYGRYPHFNEERNAEIYDYSAMVYMSSLVNQMVEMKIKNPGQIIRSILGGE